jgi:hypothetical protein
LASAEPPFHIPQNRVSALVPTDEGKSRTGSVNPVRSSFCSAAVERPPPGLVK